jgi:hypothetical protein
MDEPNPRWLLVMYITIAMTFFPLAGYSAGAVIKGVELGVVISLATGISMGVKLLLDHAASMSWSKQEK